MIILIPLLVVTLILGTIAVYIECSAPSDDY